MPNTIKLLFLAATIAGFTSAAKADSQSDYARVMSAMSASPDDGSDADNAAAPLSSANGTSTSTSTSIFNANAGSGSTPTPTPTPQPISIYGTQGFRGTAGASSQVSGGTPTSGGIQIFHPGIPPLNQ